MKYVTVEPVKNFDVPEDIAEWMQSDEGMSWLDLYYQLAFDEGYDNGFATGLVFGGTEDAEER